MDFTEVLIKPVVSGASCEGFLVASFLVWYSLIWLIPQKCNPLSPLSLVFVTGAVQANGQIPRIVPPSRAEVAETQKQVDTSEAQVSRHQQCTS